MTVKHFSSSVSPKGQVTIPAEVRARLGIKPKDRVTITLDGDEVRLRPARFTLESACGSVPALPRGLDLEEIERIAREEHVAHLIAELEAE